MILGWNDPIFTIQFHIIFGMDSPYIRLLLFLPKEHYVPPDLSPENEGAGAKLCRKNVH